MNEKELKLLSAEQYEETKQYLFAIQIYVQLLSEEPFDRRIILRLAHLYEKMKLQDKVKELINKYLSKFPQDNEMINLYSQFLLRIKDYSYLLDLLEDFNEKEKIPEVNYYLGLASLESGKVLDAKAYFSDYLQNGKQDKFRIPVLFVLSEICIRQKEFDEALEYLEVLEKAELEELGRVYYLFAKVFFGKGLFYYAQDFILRSISRNFIAEDSFLLAGKIHFEIGEYEKSEEFFNKSLQENKPTPEIFSFLGFVNINRNNLDKAREFMMLALELDPFDEYVLALKRTLLNV